MPKRKINSRAKGKRGELEVAHLFNDIFGCSSIRGQQRSGAETADVVGVHDKLHIEVKRPSRLAFWSYIRQARRDSKPGQLPVVVFRPDGDTDWYIAVSVESLPEFARIVHTELGDNDASSNQGQARDRAELPRDDGGRVPEGT